MATIYFQGFFDDLFAGNVDGADIRTILVMTDTTCDTEDSAQTMADFTDVDECDGVGYQALDHTVSSNAYDGTDKRWEIHVASDEGFSAAGAVNGSSRDVQGAVVKRYVDGGSNDVPWLYTDELANLPLTPDGGDIGFAPAGAGFIIVRPAD